MSLQDVEVLSLVSDQRYFTKSLRNVDAFRGLFCARLLSP